MSQRVRGARRTLRNVAILVLTAVLAAGTVSLSLGYTMRLSVPPKWWVGTAPFVMHVQLADGKHTCVSRRVGQVFGLGPVEILIVRRDGP